MNNCQKCGNPLQPGQTICPICGTNINEISTNQEAIGLETNSLENVAPPKEQLQSVQILPSNETLVEVGQPVMQSVEPSVGIESNPMAPVGNPIGETPSVQPTPGVISPSVMSQSAPTPIPGTPYPQPSLETLAPNITASPSASPVPSMPAGVTPVINTTLQPTEQKKKKGKFSRNQKVIIFGALVIMLVAVIGVMMSSKSMTLPQNNIATSNNPETPKEGTPQDTTTVALKEAVTNGYKLKYEEGWLIEEDSYNVLMKKSDESIVIKLEHFSYNLADFDQEVIESYLAQREGIASPTVEKTILNSKDAYLMTYNVVTQTGANYPVESYFINGGENLILGATIIYQNDTIKQANAKTILSLMENISYEDESVKALNSINMYYDAFSLYADIIGNSKKEEPVMNEEMGEEIPIQEENGNEEEQGIVDNSTPEDSQNTPVSETPEMN